MMIPDKDLRVTILGEGDVVSLWRRGRCFVVVLFCGNIFNLPGTDGKAMLCSYSSAPDLPEPVSRLG